jgi:hypothetical protein
VDPDPKQKPLTLPFGPLEKWKAEAPPEGFKPSDLDTGLHQ